MNSEGKIPDANAIIPEDKQSLAARSPALVSRGLRDLAGSLDTILVEMGKALRSQDSAEDVICSMIAKANEVFQSETHCLYLVDPETGILEWSPLTTSYVRDDFEPTRIDLEKRITEIGYVSTGIKRTGEGLAGWVARTGQIVVVADTSKDSRFVKEVDGRGTNEVSSIVVCPVRFEDRCLGVIELVNCVGAGGFSNRSLGLLGALSEFAVTAIENKRHARLIRDLMFTDEFTDLYNFRFFHVRLDAEINRSTRKGSDLSLICINLDVQPSANAASPWNDFRQVPFGTWLSCLAQVGSVLEACCRGGDLACRYGDTRFAILRPEEAKEKARTIAYDLVRQFDKTQWPTNTEKTIMLAAYIGVVSVPEDGTTKDQLLQIAEERMSLVRKTGRSGVAAG